MSAAVSPTDKMLREELIKQASWLPRGNSPESSRTAEKFAVRAFKGMFDELDRLAVLQLRSKNSECVLALIDSLDGRVRSTAALNCLVKYVDFHLGFGTSADILEAVPEFVYSGWAGDDKFVIRLPEDARESIAHAANESNVAMNTWVKKALGYWINMQRQIHALTVAVSAIETRLEK